MKWTIYLTILIVLIGILCLIFKVQIDFKSIFRKGIHLKRGEYGVRDVSGPQGVGKTAFCLHKLKQYENIYLLYSNVNFSNLSYTYFKGLDGLRSIIDSIDLSNDNGLKKDEKKYCIFFDELFSVITKSSKLTEQFMDILAQLRKRHIILLTTCQNWAELPLTFRRMCRYEIEIHSIPLLTGSYFLAIYKDAENMKWDDLQQDFVAPTIVTKIEKVNRVLMKSYNTNERINKDSPTNATFFSQKK